MSIGHETEPKIFPLRKVFVHRLRRDRAKEFPLQKESIGYAETESKTFTYGRVSL